MPTSPGLDLLEIATSTGPTPARAREIVDRLRRIVPFDGAWLALADPTPGSYTSLVSTGLGERTVAYLAGPQMAHDIEVTQTDRERPPLSPSDLPYPSEDLPTWAECLHPVGIHEALAVALYDRSGRHVGFLALFYGSRNPPPTVLRRRLHELTPVLAHGIDPLRPLAAVARVVRGATAGAVLYRDDTSRPLPGLDRETLLADGSPVLGVARTSIDDGQVFGSFLWPRGGRHAPDGHVRVTVFAQPAEASAQVLGAVVLSPVADLQGLTPRELEVLGLLVDGCSNQEIARALVVATRTVAAPLEHILVKLGAPTRTLAAVRAERRGCTCRGSGARRGPHGSFRRRERRPHEHAPLPARHSHQQVAPATGLHCRGRPCRRRRDRGRSRPCTGSTTCCARSPSVPCRAVNTATRTCARAWRSRPGGGADGDRHTPLLPAGYGSFGEPRDEQARRRDA